MISGEMLDCLEEKMREIRTGSPFGGVQLVLCGDVLQLPPVCRENEWPRQVFDQDGRERRADEIFGNRGLAFTACCWESCNIQTVRLETVHRQDGDAAMVRALQDVRIGRVSSVETAKLIADCEGNSTYGKHGYGEVDPIHLYPTNREADGRNQTKLGQLPGATHWTVAVDSFIGELKKDADGVETRRKLSPADVKELKAVLSIQCRATWEQELKVGAEVMLTYNVSLVNKLANGTRGVVVKIRPWNDVRDELRVRFNRLQQALECALVWPRATYSLVCRWGCHPFSLHIS